MRVRSDLSSPDLKFQSKSISCLELTEDSGQDPIVEGVTFYVRYLGSCFVINKAGDETTSEAIKSIVSMVSGGS